MKIDIVVLSYNRPSSLERLLKSLLPLKDKRISVHINDDNSPQKDELIAVFNKYKNKFSIEVKFNSRTENVGYDLNLMSSFTIGRGSHTFLMSNDDYFDDNVCQLFEQILNSNFDVGMVSYKYNDQSYRVNPIDVSEFKPSDLIYDSILFSGLIFNKSCLNDYENDKNFLADCIYSQVFIVSKIVYGNGVLKYFTNQPLLLGNDGENFFGKNSSAKNNQSDLIDRDSALSNFNYQKRLLRVVEYIDDNLNQGVYVSFLSEYKKRLIGYVLKLRTEDRKIFIEELKGNKGLSDGFIVTLKVMALLPQNISDFVYVNARKYLRKSG